ncbi:transposase [Acidithiobacillus ferriphilus]|uniref:TnsD family Tn7-like transposition protein n=1 Tax=Acidithiobacillus ferriphilus TaxID=1689834 RepID=UPI001C068601|nr:TnsD family Tn7-like transposition protein [Acidithiobacillus ferriphilus]MBU2848648.1 transposase [Acidithiobacillus ferriphilus]
MLAYLPAVHPDELLYSLLARVYRYGGWCNPKLAQEEFFGRRNVRAGVFLQTELNRLANHLPPRRGLTAERLVHDTTLLPYLTAFQTPEVRDWALAALCGENGDADAVYARLGLAASIVRLPNALRYCPVCRMEMLDRYSELYWRRDHQLPGVLVCPTHAAPLADSRVFLAQTGQHEFIAANEENCPANPMLPNWSDRAKTMTLLQEIAKASASVLVNPPKPQSLQRWGEECRWALRARGFGRGHSYIDQPALREAYLTHFGGIIDVLPEAAPDGWLETITHKHRKSFAPLRHILMQQLIDSHGRVEDVHPFGLGPWLCRNPLADHYGQPVITDCHLHEEGRKTIGVFRCTCGYAFSTAPNSRPRILSLGALFEIRLRGLVRTGTGLRATARALHVDSNTVLRYVAKLGLSTPWKNRPEPAKLPPIDRSGMRAAWNNAHAAAPDLARKQLRMRIPEVYAWLYRHDREWLNVQPPAPALPFPHKARINWAAIDAETAEILQRESQILLTNVPPVAVTRAALERTLGRRGWLEKRLHKLPLCSAVLREVTESDEAFQCRRVEWAEAELRRQGLPVQVWRLRRLAGLPEYCTEAVEFTLRRAEDRAAS